MPPPPSPPPPSSSSAPSSSCLCCGDQNMSCTLAELEHALLSSASAAYLWSLPLCPCCSYCSTAQQRFHAYIRNKLRTKLNYTTMSAALSLPHLSTRRSVRPISCEKGRFTPLQSDDTPHAPETGRCWISSSPARSGPGTSGSSAGATPRRPARSPVGTDRTTRIAGPATRGTLLRRSISRRFSGGKKSTANRGPPKSLRR